MLAADRSNLEVTVTTQLRNKGGACLTIHATANAPSTPAAVPIAVGDGGRCGGSKLVVIDELGRVEGVIVSVIEAVVLNVEHLRVLLSLIQLFDDLAPHLLRHCGLDRIADRGHLDLHHQQLVVVVPGIDQRPQPTRRDDAGVDITLVSESTRVS